MSKPSNWLFGANSVKIFEKAQKNQIFTENYSMIDLEHRYRRNDNFVFRRIEDETILVPIKDNVGDMGSIYSLNEIGAFIWEHLDGDRRLNTIMELILDEYDVSTNQAELDVNEFIVDLVDIDAVDLVD